MSTSTGLFWPTSGNVSPSASSCTIGLLSTASGDSVMWQLTCCIACTSPLIGPFRPSTGAESLCTCSCSCTLWVSLSPCGDSLRIISSSLSTWSPLFETGSVSPCWHSNSVTQPSSRPEQTCWIACKSVLEFIKFGVAPPPLTRMCDKHQAIKCKTRTNPLYRVQVRPWIQQIWLNAVTPPITQIPISYHQHQTFHKTLNSYYLHQSDKCSYLQCKHHHPGLNPQHPGWYPGPSVHPALFWALWGRCITARGLDIPVSTLWAPWLVVSCYQLSPDMPLQDVLSCDNESRSASPCNPGQSDCWQT